MYSTFSHTNTNYGINEFLSTPTVAPLFVTLKFIDLLEALEVMQQELLFSIWGRAATPERESLNWTSLSFYSVSQPLQLGQTLLNSTIKQILHKPNPAVLFPNTFPSQSKKHHHLLMSHVTQHWRHQRKLLQKYNGNQLGHLKILIRFLRQQILKRTQILYPHAMSTEMEDNRVPALQIPQAVVKHLPDVSPSGQKLRVGSRPVDELTNAIPLEPKPWN